MMNLKLPTCDCEDATAKTIIQKTVARQRRISYQKTLQQSTIHFSCTNHKPSPYLLCENKECDLSIDPRGFYLSIVPIGLEYLSLGSFGKVNLAGQGVQDV